jgi:hypothetical protein
MELEVRTFQNPKQKTAIAASIIGSLYARKISTYSTGIDSIHAISASLKPFPFLL